MEPSEAAPVPPSSLAGRMFNIFAAPTEVIDEVKAAKPSTANWLVPLLLAIVVGILSVFIIYSQPAILQQLQEQQSKAFDDQVKAGKMTREQADQAEAMSAKMFGPSMMRIMGIVSVTFIYVIRLFWWALVLWLLGRFLLQAKFPYGKALEVVGLAYMISILGGLVGALLTVALGKISTASLALFAGSLPPQGLLHTALQSVDFFDLWVLGIMTVGLARLASVPFSRALSLTICYWLVMEGIIIGVVWFFTALGSGFK